MVLLLGKCGNYKRNNQRNKSSNQYNKYVNLTKERLFNYTLLEENIAHYKFVIDDIRKVNFGTSKSIVVFQPKTGEPISLLDRRAAKIAILEKCIERDQYELKELDRALSKVSQDHYYFLIKKYFFEHKKMKVIEKESNLDISNISRNIYRMLDVMSVVLYGADVYKNTQ